MTAEYHRLGDYIREVNVRNRELKVIMPRDIRTFHPFSDIMGDTDYSYYNKQDD